MSSPSSLVPKSASRIYKANIDDKRDRDISIPAQTSKLTPTILQADSIVHESPGDGDENYLFDVPLNAPRTASLHSLRPSEFLRAHVSAATVSRASIDDKRDPDVSIMTQASTMLRSLSTEQLSIAALPTASARRSLRVSEAPSLPRENLYYSPVVSIMPNVVDDSISSLSVPRPCIADLSQALTLADKEAATFMKPPSPPPDIVRGYNKQLDEPRPTTIQDYLRNFEVLFVIDDSGSMAGSRWKETRDALGDIAEYAFEVNVHTVSLRFLNNVTYVRGLQRKANVMSLFDRVRPGGGTPLGAVLNIVFKQHLDRIDAAIRRGDSEYSRILPLDIIVLTDGMPTDEPADVVAQAVQRLRSSHYHPNTMGVQFVQIADEESAKQVLKQLVLGDNSRIVDTVPYRGVVTSQKLQRILLGGLHPNIRSLLPVDMLAI